MTRSLRPVPADALRAALRPHAAGVVVVTAAGERGPAGLTATSFTKVSLTPPLVSFYIGQSASAWHTVRDADYFAVHVLGVRQRALATRFATSGIDRFAAPTTWRPGPGGVPLLDGVVTQLVCAQLSTRPIGDHHLVLGTVVAVAHGPDDAGLVHRDGALVPVASSITQAS
jgi:flavin reductase (DIM6/NTAB) family NADH-FMN oxidoreductase RutF